MNPNGKIPKKYSCEICHYYTCNKKDFTKHNTTDKHLTLTNFTPKSPKNKLYSCNCGKTYKHASSLCAHKKKCNDIKEGTFENTINNNISDKKLIMILIKENSEFKQLMIDQNKQLLELTKQTGNNINNNITNNFNLNFFLNETCKNAMNIKDFVSQLQVGLKELEYTGRLGFAEGISKIFINGLKDIDINDRPIHCSDFKREVVYIKDNDQWNKDTEDKPLLTSAIKQVARKNIKQISEWTKDHPEYNDSSSKQNDKYLKIVSEAMSGSSIEETNKNYNKIIKNIVKETVIDK